MVFRNTHVKAVWFLNQPTGIAFVTFSKNSNLADICEKLRSKGFVVNIHNENERKVNVFKIFKTDKFIDEINLKKVLSKFGQVEQVFLVKTGIDEKSLIENADKEKLKIEEFFRKYGSLKNIHILPYTYSRAGKIKPKTSVYLTYDSVEATDKVIYELNNRVITKDTGLMGYGRMHLTKSFIRESKIPDEVIEILDVESIQDYIKKEFNSILEHKKKVDKHENHLMIIKSLDELFFSQAVRFANKFFLPISISLDCFSHNELIKILNNKDHVNCQANLESKFKVRLVNDSRHSKVDMYGADKEMAREILMKEVNNFELATLRTSSFKVVLKHLDKLRDEFEGEISLDFRNKITQFRSNKSQIKELEEMIRHLELNENYNTEKTTRNGDLCPICMDEIINPFRLMLCEHEFCFECISSQFKSYDMNSSSLNCLVCNKEIALSDLKCLARNDMSLFNQKCSIALSKYMLNQNKYMYCSLNSCNKICEKVKEDQMYCQQCEDYLNWSSEREAELKINEELYQEFINSNKDVKKCPNEECKKPIMKNKGCNHMQCFYCKVHFCWTCLFRSTAESDIYDHMRKEHDGIGVDALDLDGLILDDMDFDF
jgi:hypothetical protein